MGLNETMAFLAAKDANAKKADMTSDTDAKNMKIAELAERIFFQKMLAYINIGMGEQKIDAMIDRSVIIAQRIYKKIYMTN